MELKSTPKIIDFTGFSNKININQNTSAICHYSIRFDTDANVSIVVDVPIEEICTVSDTANRRMRFPGAREHIMNRMVEIANSYEKLYDSLGIRVLHWEVRADDPE